jgi:hypothetical protein
VGASQQERALRLAEAELGGAEECDTSLIVAPEARQEVAANRGKQG